MDNTQFTDLRKLMTDIRTELKEIKDLLDVIARSQAKMANIDWPPDSGPFQGKKLPIPPRSK